MSLANLLASSRRPDRVAAVGSVAGAAVIEIVATLLTVKLLVPMSSLEQAVPKDD
jgi:hypothetical protein